MMELMKWLRTKRSEREHGKTRFGFFGSDIATNGENNNITTTTATTRIQFYSTLKRDKKNCVEFNEPIFMVKTHDLTERLNSETLIAALFDLFGLLTMMMITTTRERKSSESPVRCETKAPNRGFVIVWNKIQFMKSHQHRNKIIKLKAA